MELLSGSWRWSSWDIESPSTSASTLYRLYVSIATSRPMPGVKPGRSR